MARPRKVIDPETITRIIADMYSLASVPLSPEDPETALWTLGKLKSLVKELDQKLDNGVRASTRHREYIARETAA